MTRILAGQCIDGMTSYSERSKRVYRKKAKLVKGFFSGTGGSAQLEPALGHALGGKIVDIGFHPEHTSETGLTIYYEKGRKTYAMVFGGTDLGFWLEFLGEVKA